MKAGTSHFLENKIGQINWNELNEKNLQNKYDLLFKIVNETIDTFRSSEK